LLPKSGADTTGNPKKAQAYAAIPAALSITTTLEFLIDFLFSMRPPTIQPATRLELPDTTILVGDTY